MPMDSEYLVEHILIIKVLASFLEEHWNCSTTFARYFLALLEVGIAPLHGQPVGALPLL
jgi:hypothetical protein